MFRPRGGTGTQHTRRRPPIGIKVIVRDKDLVGALKRLKRIREREGLIREERRHRYYEKPSEAKRREAKERAKRLKKLQAARG
jgi:small subunit ribosomal protein S21